MLRGWIDGRFLTCNMSLVSRRGVPPLPSLVEVSTMTMMMKAMMMTKGIIELIIIIMPMIITNANLPCLPLPSPIFWLCPVSRAFRPATMKLGMELGNEEVSDNIDIWISVLIIFFPIQITEKYSIVVLPPSGRGPNTGLWQYCWSEKKECHVNGFC